MEGKISGCVFLYPDPVPIANHCRGSFLRWGENFRGCANVQYIFPVLTRSSLFPWLRSFFSTVFPNNFLTASLYTRLANHLSLAKLLFADREIRLSMLVIEEQWWSECLEHSKVMAHMCKQYCFFSLLLFLLLFLREKKKQRFAKCS